MWPFKKKTFCPVLMSKRIDVLIELHANIDRSIYNFERFGCDEFFRGPATAELNKSRAKEYRKECDKRADMICSMIRILGLENVSAIAVDFYNRHHKALGE